MRLCECGCGQPTIRIQQTSNKRGRIKGEYNKFLNGHGARKKPMQLINNKLCECGCGQKIVIKEWHRRYGIPRFITGHNSKTKENKKIKSEARSAELGEKNNNWQGGITLEPYPITFDNQLKDKIRARDNFICQKCGVPELECDKRLAIHHIDYDKKNCEDDNLISLCNSCNPKVNANREYWTNYFQQKLQRRKENANGIRAFTSSQKPI